LSSIILTEDLGAISMLAIEVTIFVFDQNDVILANLSHNSGFCISLLQAVDLWQVFADSIFIFSSETFVISNGPCKFISLELSEITIWPKNFDVEVVEMTNNNTALEMDSVNLSSWFWVFEGCISDLNNITIWHMSDNETVFDG
jgi:hypothetical protein